ncbi:hypothetical protein K0M31_013904 [Melipona bicolor]|uniref:Uncharacterized protein n=1 Tax=Melipona bicolor TaxID=60889 RepID=A0AA40G7R7_9HYME|nr:hypothetical protein K0M31_013904 [Melipona bicolor]
MHHRLSGEYQTRVFVTPRVGMSERGSQRTRNGGDSLEMERRYLGAEEHVINEKDESLMSSDKPCLSTVLMTTTTTIAHMGILPARDKGNSVVSHRRR